MTLLRLLSNFSPSARSGILRGRVREEGAADPSSNELWHYFSYNTVGAYETEAGREAATDSWLTRKDFLGAGCKILNDKLPQGSNQEDDLQKTLAAFSGKWKKAGRTQSSCAGMVAQVIMTKT